ncbi:hypothetical protein EYF80_038891 [Liparis tanakae]|uniref:Uncharacterized protein n=1 Tax=Liparis tanakae TaxID=230148 RepID=A0A4Z2GCC8_9TELE|nr:hypothetical protein EYF80_038891 [Liparis tanakae]
MDIKHDDADRGVCLPASLKASSPMAVQSVVVSAVEASLGGPIKERLGKKPREEVVESADMNHVQGKAVTAHPAHHPGALARAEKDRLISTAISPPELPMPTTTALFPL